jgi:ATP-dependent Clp protease, protease subunit
MEAQYWIPTVSHNGQYLDVYSAMLADGIIFVNTRVDQRVAGLITSCLLHVQAKPDTGQQPKIYLNTKQGDLISAMTVVDIMEFYNGKGVHVQTAAFGEIGVASALILAAGAKGSRKVAAHSLLCLRLGTESLEFGAISSNQAKGTQEAKLRETAVRLLAKYSGQDPDDLLHYINREAYLESAEVIRLGLADGTI